jgi:transcriptional regulator of acetoin/glycerol metabolism
MWGKPDASIPSLAVEPAWLVDSYRRCEEAGVARGRETLAVPERDAGFLAYLARQRRLHAFIERVVAEAGPHLPSPRLMLLTDREARIELLMTARKSPDGVEPCGIAIGASLAESTAGTTAVALALRHRAPVTVTGPQHFCACWREWSCYAAPILEGETSVRGCLALVSPNGVLGATHAALVEFLAREVQHFAAARSATNNGVALTSRQLQVLSLFAEGLSYKQIAKELNVRSRKTIEDHLDAIRAKLGTASRRECIRRAIELGLL